MAVREGLLTPFGPSSRAPTFFRFALIEPSSRVLIPLAETKKPRQLAKALLYEFDGGEGGIRTLDTFPYTHFPGVLLRPLGHLTEMLLVASSGAYIKSNVLLSQAFFREIEYLFSHRRKTPLFTLKRQQHTNTKKADNYLHHYS